MCLDFTKVHWVVPLNRQPAMALPLITCPVVLTSMVTVGHVPEGFCADVSGVHHIHTVR